MRRQACFSALALAALTGCAGAPHKLEQGKLIEAPERAQPSDKGCGLACLDALVSYHERRLDAEAQARFSPQRLEAKGGARAGDMRDELRRLGFRAALVQGTFKRGEATSIYDLLDRDLPVIVEIASQFDLSQARRHYVLVTGYDSENDLVLVMDPADGELGAMPTGNFRKAWDRGRRLMLVAAPA